jgi:hypothetical protein
VGLELSEAFNRLSRSCQKEQNEFLSGEHPIPTEAFRHFSPEGKSMAANSRWITRRCKGNWAEDEA